MISDVRLDEAQAASIVRSQLPELCSCMAISPASTCCTMPARGQVTGIIDWSEMALSDPGIDLAALYYWGARALALCPGGRDEWAPK